MDVTSIQCGKHTRDELKEYRDANGLDNYDEALQSLLLLAHETGDWG